MNAINLWTSSRPSDTIDGLQLQWPDNGQSQIRSLSMTRNRMVVGSCNSYEEIAQNLRKLRDEDVEMEDATDWPASWNEDGLEPQDGKEVADTETHVGGTRRHTVQPASKEERHIVYIALDTNIFISHLGTVQAIHKRLSEIYRNRGNGTEAVTTRLLVPNVVIHELDKQKNIWSEPPSAMQSSSVRTLQASKHAKTSQGSGHPGRASPTLAAAARAAIEWLLKIRQAQRCGGTDQTLSELCVFQKKGEVKDRNMIVGHCLWTPLFPT
ncbi:hypothetical protein QFC20_002744 [Naganishia adeliensis]|uniref:Uncharacterized protein n=1 Tax=Naganishia adeliensis TaxID=92952 RepID=A0ACC2WH73_9TREE|nr:hypothetical protein QFC20_002744 [Naganishia adeliensis]